VHRQRRHILHLLLRSSQCYCFAYFILHNISCYIACCLQLLYNYVLLVDLYVWWADMGVLWVDMVVWWLVVVDRGCDRPFSA
jgi:hypothetical protein